MRKPLVLVVGPTAVGKTATAVKISKRIDGEVVSTDSMQIYKYMDIGTAKPNSEEMQGIKHHMMDIITPDVDFNVSKYQQMALPIIEDIYDRGKIPVICGGTGLYVDSLIYNIDFSDAKVDNSLREKLQRTAEVKGASYLHNMLKEMDPVSAEKIHQNNTKRVIRAIEVYKSTGISLHQIKKDYRNNDYRYDVVKIGINSDREVLYKRINHRVDLMMNDGLLKEVKSLLGMGYTKDMLSMQGLGYKEVISYFEGEYTKDRCIELIKQGSRRYAKRQLTWFKRETNIMWHQREEFGNNNKFLSQMLEHFEKSYAIHL